MKLVAQLPALNEEKSIERVLAAIPRRVPGVDEVVVLVVDDGSTDRTAELARAAGAVVVSHVRNRGVGAAFRTGLAKATDLDADVIVTLDADGQFDPEDIPKLIDPILRGQADFVTASRFLDPALVPEMPAAKRWGNDFMARWISSIALGRSKGLGRYSKAPPWKADTALSRSENAVITITGSAGCEPCTRASRSRPDSPAASGMRMSLTSTMGTP